MNTMAERKNELWWKIVAVLYLVGMFFTGCYVVEFRYDEWVSDKTARTQPEMKVLMATIAWPVYLVGKEVRSAFRSLNESLDPTEPCEECEAFKRKEAAERLDEWERKRKEYTPEQVAKTKELHREWIKNREAQTEYSRKLEEILNPKTDGDGNE